MPSGDYTWYRKTFQDVSADLDATASTGDTTLVTVRNANHTLFIQRIFVWITTDAAQSWSFKDSAGTPIVKAKVPTSPGADTLWTFDYGEEGTPLTEGTNLLLDVSAAGLAGTIKVQAYSKLTSTVAAASA